MENHPCIGCINNWSGDLIGCADFCEARDQWQKEHPSFQNQEMNKIILSPVILPH